MKKVSLLPYLSGTGQGFSLELSLIQEETVEGRSSRFPYEVVNDASPLTRMLGARVVSDGGGVVRRVFLLMSRDEYPLQEQGISPLNNPDIEAAWQRAFRGHRRAGDLIPLASQVDDSGALVAFSPLFACMHTGRFFHPPCPQCGTELDLVRDDDVLAQAGLKPFSTSLRRYLTCPACAGKPGAAFYAGRPDETDPRLVRGPVDIIQGLAGLDGTAVPCTGCPERQSCHGSGHLSDRILPIAFYPFHMFMFEAASLNAADFLALVSGAPFGELQAALEVRQEFTRRAYVGRLGERCTDPVLFMGDDRRFAETLYLKLAFLGEVAGHVLNNPDDFAYPRLGPSLERLWVHISEQSGYLPLFWGFRLALMDMDPQIPTVLPAPGSDYAAHVMGLLWFHALLGNRALDVRAVNEGLRGMVKDKNLCMDNPVLAPGNIFWEAAPVSSRWLPLWERTLRLGSSLLLNEGTGGFLDTYRELLSELRSELFSGPVVPTEPALAEAAVHVDNAQIGLVIKAIHERWAAAAEAVRQKSAPEPPRDAMEGGFEATVVVPAQPVQEVAPEVVDDDFSTETVIMKRETVPPAAVKEEQAAMDQTVVMGASPEIKEKKAQKPEEDALSETVVMGPRTEAAQRPTQQPPRKKDDDLAETVIIKPEKK